MAVATMSLLLAMGLARVGSPSPLVPPLPAMERPDSAPAAAPSPPATVPAAERPADSPSTAPSPQGTPSPACPQHTLKVTRFYTGDEAGFPRKRFWSVEPAVYFFAKIAPRATPSKKGTGPVEPSRFEVVVRDTMGHEVTRMGGPVPGALVPTVADLPRDCTNAPDNGLRLAGTALADRPGRYLALAVLDGLPVAQQVFTVQRLRGDGRIVVTSAAVENSAGDRRFTFTPDDPGVYAHVTVVNATRDRAHEHLVEVAFEGPRGRVGRVLGGLLRVSKGARLDGRDLPTMNDPSHHDGLRIKGTPVAAMLGPWKMTVYVDGVAVREVPFRIVDPRKPAGLPAPTP